MSHYIFKARLCGLICAECREPLSDTIVRLYRSDPDRDVAAQAAAEAKDTFRALGDDDVAAKQDRLIAEATTDADGGVTFALGENDGYDGGAFEIDIVCASVPGAGKGGVAPRQFSITTLAPRWREGEDGLLAAWEYCLPHRIWCWIRGLFGAWTICGRVVLCEGGKPIGGVKVRAFDRDWLQDDPLGTATTDGDGRFRIDYSWTAFQPGTFIDVELFGGPDLFFRVETASGAPLLVEPASRGRDADRENVGPCFCVELCVDEVPPPDPEPIPVFTHVGGYKHTTQIQAGNGLTAGDDRAFFHTLRLNGVLAKKLNGNPMEYRFEVRTTNAAGVPTSGWTAISPGQIARTKIGDLEYYAPAFPGDPDPIKTRDYTVNGTPGPDEVVASIVGGWIRVPQESNVFAGGFFVPNGNMINLVSQTLAAFTPIDKTGLVTGSSASPVGQNDHFSLRMRVREVGNPASEVNAGTCQHIAIENTLYDNVLHHPAWMAVLESGALGIAMVDVAQLAAGAGCVDIEDDLDVVFTAGHPNLGAVSITLSGPGGPYGFTLPAPATPGDRFGTATPAFVVADLQPCAYIVTLTVQLLLTTGDSIPSNLTDQIAFCKA